MPPKAKVSSRDVVDAALQLVRQSGIEALNARNIAGMLHCSTQPVVTNFATMEQLKQAVIAEAENMYLSRQQEDMNRGDEPPYKACGLSYIRFAQEEKHLLRLLFMRDRKEEAITASTAELEFMYAMLQGMLGLSPQDARAFHLEMWVYVHGIAAMIATNYLPWNRDRVSRMLTDQFRAMRAYYLSKEN